MSRWEEQWHSLLCSSRWTRLIHSCEWAGVGELCLYIHHTHAHRSFTVSAFPRVLVKSTRLFDMSHTFTTQPWGTHWHVERLFSLTSSPRQVSVFADVFSPTRQWDLSDEQRHISVFWAQTARHQSGWLTSVKWFVLFIAKVLVIVCRGRFWYGGNEFACSRFFFLKLFWRINTLIWPL